MHKYLMNSLNMENTDKCLKNSKERKETINNGKK